MTTEFTHLPYNLPGQIYRSVMPFGGYDTGGAIYQAYRDHNVRVVVVLAEKDEMLKKSGRDLLDLYARDGLRVIHAPIPDYTAPDRDKLALALQAALSAARAGENVAVHCHAGIGRTGTFLACLACEVFGYSGDQAIEWVRQYVPGAVETPDQEDLVREYTR